MPRSALMSPRSPQDPPPAPAAAAVWFNLVGGGAAWMLHLLLAYVIAEFGCLSGLGEVHLAGLTAVAWLLIGTSALALALASAATATSIRIGQHLQGPHSAKMKTADLEATAFSGRLGLISNIVFTVVILVQSVPIFFYLREC